MSVPDQPNPDQPVMAVSNRALSVATADLVDLVRRSNLGADEKVALTAAVSANAAGQQQRSTGLSLDRLLRKPRRFDGAQENPRTWFEDYEFCAEINNWGDVEKARYFPAFLDGSAVKWYR